MTLHDYLFTLLLAMAPVSELRGAIPFGLAHDIPQALLYPSCILANLLPVPFVILFLRRILAWMQRKGGRLAAAAGWLEKRPPDRVYHIHFFAACQIFFRRVSPVLSASLSGILPGEQEPAAHERCTAGALCVFPVQVLDGLGIHQWKAHKPARV